PLLPRDAAEIDGSTLAPAQLVEPDPGVQLVDRGVLDKPYLRCRLCDSAALLLARGSHVMPPLLSVLKAPPAARACQTSSRCRSQLGLSTVSVAVDLDQAGVADPEVVCDLVQHHAADLAVETVRIVSEEPFQRAAE